jgi:Gpi18-like mannosyltransferase
MTTPILGSGCHSMRLRPAIAALILLCILAGYSAPLRAVDLPPNFVTNGDLVTGGERVPDRWFGLAQNRKEAVFGWTPGEMTIANRGANYASWHQTFMLRPGWYRVSVSARVSGASANGAGASVAIQTYEGMRLVSSAVHGSADWTEIAMYLRVDRWGDVTEILCQLGEQKNLETGSAGFRDVRVVTVEHPANDGAPVYDLASMERIIPGLGSDHDYQTALGVACAFALIAILAGCLRTIWKPGLERAGVAIAIGCAIAVGVAIIETSALFHFQGYFWDIWAKTNRAILAVQVGPRDIYNPGWPVDSYPPGSLYLLWLSGWLGRMLQPGANGFRVLVEWPPVVSSLIVALTILFAVRGERRWAPVAAMAAFALNPALIFDTVIWGQSDANVALPMLAGAILIVTRRWRAGWLAVGIAVLVKPQAIAMVPPLAVWTLMQAGVRESIFCAALGAGALALGIVPFQAGHPLDWMIEVYRNLGGRFTFASMGALNLHAMLGGLELDDSSRVAGVSYFAMGISALCAADLISIYLAARARNSVDAMLAAVIASLAFFMFAPRMHERYLYYPIILMAPLVVANRAFAWFFAALSAGALFNLYFMKYLADTSTFAATHRAWPLAIAAAINVEIFLALLIYALERGRSGSRRDPVFRSDV